MLPLSSRHPHEPDALSKKPPASVDFHPEPLLDSDEAAAIMRMHGKGLSGACSSVPCGDSAQAISTAGSPSVLLDRRISTKPLPGVR